MFSPSCSEKSVRMLDSLESGQLFHWLNVIHVVARHEAT